ncbi:MAG: protein-L-isoaspartate(D-aspartate) O-methyltransferase [Sterolibacterium sp.]|jgi:protein-L-isoaspartate(D-aspartate) O-methyltransferase
MNASLERMLHEIQVETADSSAWTGISAIEPAVIDALRQTDRGAFVGDDYRHLAYANRPLPVGFGQTISQPFIVALMTQLLLPRPDATMLEIGTGSCYQAAVLARLVKRVVSIEIIAALAERATKQIAKLAIDNVDIHHGDGYRGWPELAPYDGIIVTACATEIPPPLIEQLKPGARMVIPVGAAYGPQDLLVVEKSLAGVTSSRSVLPVAFVPFKRSADDPALA